MRRPDQAPARSAATLIRHEANKKLTMMAALASTVDLPVASPGAFPIFAVKQGIRRFASRYLHCK